MRVLVIGASGAIGTHLVPQLRAQGHDGIGSSRSSSKAERLRALGAEPIELDVLDAEATREAVAHAQLAADAGLAIDNGIVVDEMLLTSHEDVYAAGDVAAYFDPIVGKRRRVEHEDNATTMGRWAGRAMAGQPEPYHYQPYFYSDLFELGYEAVGELDARLETVADWKEPCRQGVIYYLDGGRVRGVLLWNVWGQVDAARQLIAEPGPFRPGDLIGRIGGS